MTRVLDFVYPNFVFFMSNPFFFAMLVVKRCQQSSTANHKEPNLEIQTHFVLKLLGPIGLQDYNITGLVCLIL